MTKELFDAVYSNRDDDEVKLVLADYLEEQGDHRGEFIRTQLKLAAFSEADDDFYEVRDHSHDLLNEYGETWLDELSREIVYGRFYKGFIHEASIPAQALMQMDWDILPFQELVISDEDKLGDIHEANWIPSLEQIRFSPKTSSEDLLRFFFSNELTSLKQFRLSEAFDTAASTREFRTASFLPSLRSLRIDSIAVASHLCGVTLPDLTELYVRDRSRGKSLDLSALTPCLTKLSIQFPISAACAPTLCCLPLSQVKECWLGGRTAIPHHATKVLGESGLFRNLEKLTIEASEIDTRTIEDVFSESFSECEELEFVIHNADAADSILKHLSDLDLTNLKSLHLYNVSAHSLNRFFDESALPNLQRLSLHSCELSTQVIRKLRQHSIRQSLRVLSLQCEFVEDVVRELSECRFPNVRLLDMYQAWVWRELSAIDTQATLELLKNNVFPQLREIRVANSVDTTALLQAMSRIELHRLKSVNLLKDYLNTEVCENLLSSRQYLGRLWVNVSGSAQNVQIDEDQLKAKFGKRFQTSQRAAFFPRKQRVQQHLDW